MVKGSSQVEKNEKSEKNSDWSDYTHPPPIHLKKKLETFANMKTTQKTQKIT